MGKDGVAMLIVLASGGNGIMTYIEQKEKMIVMTAVSKAMTNVHPGPTGTSTPENQAHSRMSV